MLMSPSQSKELHVNHSTLTASNPSEDSTTAVVAVMRGNPKDGYTRQSSNKHCKQKIVRVLLDSGSNGNLIFVNIDKPMPWLGILIFGSDFWDPHRKQNSDSMFDSKDSGWNLFLKFRCLESQKIGIPSWDI